MNHLITTILDKPTISVNNPEAMNLANLQWMQWEIDAYAKENYSVWAIKIPILLREFYPAHG